MPDANAPATPASTTSIGAPPTAAAVLASAAPSPTPAAAPPTATPTAEATPAAVPAAPPKPVSTEPAKPPDKPVATVDATTARAEQAFRQREAAFKAEREKWEQERKQHEADAAFARELRELAPKSKLKALEKLGIKPQEVNDELLAEVEGDVAKRSDLVAVEQRVLDRVKAEREEAEKAAAETKRRAVEEAKKQFAVEGDEWIAANKKSHPLTALEANGTLLAEVVEQHHAETGKVLSTKEAADLVEQHLRKRLETYQAALKSEAPTPDKKSDPQGTVPTVPAARVTGAGGATPAPSPGHLSLDERARRAAAAMEEVARRQQGGAA